MYIIFVVIFTQKFSRFKLKDGLFALNVAGSTRRRNPCARLAVNLNLQEFNLNIIKKNLLLINYKNIFLKFIKGVVLIFVIKNKVVGFLHN